MFKTIPVMRHNTHIGNLLQDGTEIHCECFPEYRKQWASKGFFREYFKPLLDEHCFLTTRILHTRTEPQAFIERIGFVETWRDETYRYYILTELPFSRG